MVRNIADSVNNMSNTEDICYCPACIVTRKGYAIKECLRKKMEIKKDDGEQTKLF
jgi:hypothetical protein